MMQGLLLVVGAIIILAAFLWVLVPALYGLPPISAGRERIRKALELADLKPGELFYDLGSGHGRVLVMAAREFGALAVGVEAGPVQCLVSRLNALGNGVNSKVQIKVGNMYRADLSKANVVYAYLTSGYSIKLGEKFERELQNGTRVVTISFDLTGWQPEYVDRENLIFVYRK
jgi:hypothetical protein